MLLRVLFLNQKFDSRAEEGKTWWNIFLAYFLKKKNEKGKAQVEVRKILK